MEQDGGGQAAGDQFSGVEVSVEEAGDGVRCENWLAKQETRSHKISRD